MAKTHNNGFGLGIILTICTVILAGITFLSSFDNIDTTGATIRNWGPPLALTILAAVLAIYEFSRDKS